MTPLRKLLILGVTLTILFIVTLLLILFYGPEQRKHDSLEHSVSPQVTRQMLLMASDLFEQERYPETERVLRRLLGFDRYNTSALRMLGNLQYITGRYLEASNTFRVILARNPKDPVARSNLGMSMIRLQWHEAGIRELLTARIQDPELPFIDLNLGHAYQELGNLEKAAYYLKIAEEKGLPPSQQVSSPGVVPHE